MYTIHALVNSKCVPLVYSFLPRKTQVIYEKFLQIIAEKLSKVPKSLTIDFELAFLNACMIIFPGVPMYLCFFVQYIAQTNKSLLEATKVRGYVQKFDVSLNDN